MKPSIKNKLSPEDVKYITNLLRQGTVKWSGRAECLRRARKKVQEGYTKDGRPKFKFHWQCAICRKWHRNEKELEVDHIVEIGPFQGCIDDYARRVYCGQENLRALCVSCHAKKSGAYNSAKSRWKRKVDAA